MLGALLVAVELRRILNADDEKRRLPVTPSPMSQPRPAATAAASARVIMSAPVKTTSWGQNLYPGAPDMALADTQRLSDGELFYISRAGCESAGMPAWGERGPHDATDSWDPTARWSQRLPMWQRVVVVYVETGKGNARFAKQVLIGMPERAAPTEPHGHRTETATAAALIPRLAARRRRRRWPSRTGTPGPGRNEAGAGCCVAPRSRCPRRWS
jgi:hypothetical protein